MEQGLFITMEGPDGSGKSTQIAYLKEYFDMRGIDTIFTREPGGTPIGEGKIVICDRFIDSSIAYQGYGRQLGDAVRVINELAIEGCMPDITFLMELSPEIGKSRIKLEYQDRLELEKLEFHNRVFDGYQEIAQIYPERFVCVDAGRPKEVVRDEIYHHIDRLLQNRGGSCR